MSPRRQFERRLRDELRSARPARAAEAERRAWQVVKAAHAQDGPSRRPRRAPRIALGAAGAAALAAIALTPAGAKVSDWIGDAVTPAPKPTRSGAGPLPAGGRLLVVADGGAFVVHEDGARDRLGAYADASWSPGGLFVVAARGRRLTAIEPDGDERWTRPAPARVTAPRWSPDGYRIAYRSGPDLWVAIADNSGAKRLAAGVGATPPAWRPGMPSPGQVVAFSQGVRIRIAEVEGGRTLALTPSGPVPRELWWTADGRRLVAVAKDRIRIFSPRGRLLQTLALPPRLRAEGSALAPGGRRLAVAAPRADGRSSELLLFRLDRDAPPQQLFAGPGLIEGLSWSTDGQVLVVGLPQAGQWVFLRPGERGNWEAVSGIRDQFRGGRPPRTGAFPRPAGWCHAEPAASNPVPCSSGAAP